MHVNERRYYTRYNQFKNGCPYLRESSTVDLYSIGKKKL